MNHLTYKDFKGTAQYDARDHLFHGSVLGARARVIYHGETVAELEAAFKEAVDDYLDMCDKDGLDPHPDYDGKVHVTPELHQRIADRAAAAGKSVDDVVVEAVEALLRL